ncbi:MAG: SGNH/GDSL hydrolase family protein [Mariprofundaceae bacterium]
MRIKRNYGEVVKNIALVAVSTFVVLLMAELALRQTEIGHYSLNDRILFYTNPSFMMGADGALKYAPDSRIRSVAIYGNNIDYDVTYTTNNMGLIDNVSYGKTKPGVRDIVFVGDSFTAGSGGHNPWVGQVRELLGPSDVAVYNLGVGGAGIYHFYNLLKSFGNTIPFEEVNIMVISNDFFRGFWYPQVKGDALWFCYSGSSKETCLQNQSPIIHIIENSENEAALLARASKMYEVKRNNTDGVLKPHQKLRLFNLACDVYASNFPTASLESICPHLKVYNVAAKREKNRLYSRAMYMLRVMLADFPGVKFRLFHIPQKGEVFTGRYSLNIEDDARKIGLEYVPLLQSCAWDISMYHKHDAHPNDSGYDNLAKCMTRYLQ